MTPIEVYRRAKDRYETARQLFPLGHPRRLVLHALYRRAVKQLRQARTAA